MRKIQGVRGIGKVEQDRLKYRKCLVERALGAPRWRDVMGELVQVGVIPCECMIAWQELTNYVFSGGMDLFQSKDVDISIVARMTLIFAQVGQALCSQRDPLSPEVGAWIKEARGLEEEGSPYRAVTSLIRSCLVSSGLEQK